MASFLQKLYYDDHNVNFFKHYNTFLIPLRVVNESMKKSGNVAQILYHEYQPGTIKGAYHPMIDWVIALYGRYYAKEVSFDQFLEDAGVYSLHRRIYASYKENGVCERTEEIVPVEMEYEHERFVKGLIGVFNYISERIPLLIVLNKVHLASYSAFEFLLKMINDNANSRIAMICSFNEVYTVSLTKSTRYPIRTRKSAMTCSWRSIPAT